MTPRGCSHARQTMATLLVELVLSPFFLLGFTVLEYSADEKVVQELEGDQHLHHHVVAVMVFCRQLLSLPPPAAAAFYLVVAVSHWPCLQVVFVHNFLNTQKVTTCLQKDFGLRWKHPNHLWEVVSSARFAIVSTYTLRPPGLG